MFIIFLPVQFNECRICNKEPRTLRVIITEHVLVTKLMESRWHYIIRKLLRKQG